jgi:integrase/recombinase XerD
MDKTICSNHLTVSSDDDVPFADERHRYLRYCEESGATTGSLKAKRNELLWIATRLCPDAPKGVDIEALRRIATERQQLNGANTATRRVIDIGRPWLRFLGWWREPNVVLRDPGVLDQYVRWMRSDCGFVPRTVEVRSWIIAQFLGWCDKTNRQLRDLRPEDIDAYFVNQASGRWCRATVALTASALRVFLRYAEKRGMCTVHLAASIGRPRLYRQESLPYAPDWADVRRMLADAETDDPLDIRDRAILLLLAVYGLRSGEVAALRLDQIDWDNGTLRIFRHKRRQPQIYPLLSSAAKALKRYIDTVRPPSSCPEVFLRMHAPRRPLKAVSIYDVANRRFVALGIEVAHRGGHALRHACATRLLAEGLSMKEIGDHLGHRSSASTSLYAKVNIKALREVGAFDLGELQ